MWRCGGATGEMWRSIDLIAVIKRPERDAHKSAPPWPWLAPTILFSLLITLKCHDCLWFLSLSNDSRVVTRLRRHRLIRVISALVAGH